VIRQTDRATRLVSLHGTIGRFVRDHLMSLLSRLPGSEERIGEGLSGIAVNYRRSPIVEEHGSVMAGPTAGDRAPDAAVADANGRPLRLYDLFAEHRHTLLLLGGSEAPKIALPRDAIWLGAGGLSDTSRRLCRLALRRERSCGASASAF
jgi:hypothetical protein